MITLRLAVAISLMTVALLVYYEGAASITPVAKLLHYYKPQSSPGPEQPESRHMDKAMLQVKAIQLPTIRQSLEYGASLLYEDARLQSENSPMQVGQFYEGLPGPPVHADIPFTHDDLSVCTVGHTQGAVEYFSLSGSTASKSVPEHFCTVHLPVTSVRGR